MKRLLACLIVFSVAGAALAKDEPRLKPKNTSSFSMSSNTRNPFWPIGWKPVLSVPGDQAEQSVPARAFLVSAITIESGGRFAIINGKIMQEGQQFGLKLDGDTYHVTVGTIQDGKVTLIQNGRPIDVPLTRK